MAINNINIGALANDGTGDPIRTAFDTVNDNFAFVQAGLFAGTESSIISALSVTGGTVVANTTFSANSTTSNSVIITGQHGGNLYVQSNGAYIVGNVNIIGNLNVSGSQAASQAQASAASLLNLHYSATPLVLNDNRDIGLVWQYYTAGPEKKGFLGWQNTTGSLVYYDDITESIANVITAGTPGNVQIGSLLIANTTASTSNVTGALKVNGGIGVLGNVYVQSNVFVGNNANIGNITIRGYHVGSLNFSGLDTVYINGDPVATASSAFNGGPVALSTTFNDATQSTSVSTGAVKIATGGLGVNGNIWAANIHTQTGGNVRANIQGNIFTASQPFITSLGTLTGLTINGQLNTNDISPNANNTYSLGTGGSDRWVKIWAFDVDMSGTLTGGTVNSTGGTHTGNLAINTVSAAGLTSTTGVVEIFESGTTTIRIGGGGTTQFRNQAKTTSTTTGAVVISGGLGIGGNLHIAGSNGTGINSGAAIVPSAGNTINLGSTTNFWNFTYSNNVSSGNVSITSNIQSASATTGALVVLGGVGISGNIFTTGNVIPQANITQNLGTVTNWWGTFYGVSTQARYADLAENYLSDTTYDPGTVVVFGGTQEITVTESFADVRVAGVISTNPAYLMNAASEGLPVALRGRVPVKVLGAVSKGDLLVTSHQAGFAQSVGQNNSYGHAVFAKSLITDGRNGSKIIEAVII